MAGSVAITPTTVPVVPGQMGTASVRIRNTGVVVDQFSVTVLGEAAVWTTAVPAVLSLFPGAEGTIELHFAPPRTPTVGYGPTPFGVRVDASQDPDGSVVEEGEIDLQAFTEVQARLTPRTSETKRKARHEVLVDNRGNNDITAAIDASDPDDLLAFEIHPRTVTVPAGQSHPVPVRVAAKKGFLRGTDKQRPFQVKVNVPDNPLGTINLDGTLIQKPGMPRFIVPLVAGAVALALIALVAPALLKKGGGSGKLSLTSEESATTTTAAPAADAPADEPADPNAPATPEEAQAAADAEAKANGKDADGGSGGTSSGSGGDGGTSAAASGAPAPVTTAPPANKADNSATEVDAPPASAVPAPPPSTTTVPGATTTTTAPRPIDMYYVIRQQNDNQAHFHNLSAGNTVGQTFVANGPVITEIWFNLYGGQVTGRIRAGGPTGAVIATTPATQIVQRGWTKIVFPTPVNVTTGATLYLEGTMSASSQAWYVNNNYNDYTSGDGFLNGAAKGEDLNARVIGRTG